MPDALQLLRDDHKKVKDLFKQFEDSDDKAEKKRICDEVIMELDVHTRIEEEIFYPAVLKEDGTQEIMKMIVAREVFGRESLPYRPAAKTA